MSKSAKRRWHDGLKLTRGDVSNWKLRFEQRVALARDRIAAGGDKARYELQCKCENTECEERNHPGRGCPNVSDARKRIMDLGSLCPRCYATYPEKYRLENVFKAEAAGMRY